MWSPQKKATPEKKVFRHKSKPSYNIYIAKLLTAVDAEAGLSGNAKAAACSMVEDLLSQVAHQTKTLMEKKQTVQLHDVKSAMKIMLSKKEFDEVLSDVEKAITKYNAAEKGTKSQRSGLIFPVARILATMKRQRIGSRVSPLAAVAVTRMVETIVHDLLKEANELRKEEKVVRITAKHLKQAVDSTKSSHLFTGTFHKGGFREEIHEALLPKKSMKRAADESAAPAKEVFASKKAKKAKK